MFKGQVNIQVQVFLNNQNTPDEQDAFAYGCKRIKVDLQKNDRTSIFYLFQENVNTLSELSEEKRTPEDWQYLAVQQNNIGLLYRLYNDSASALRWHQDALQSLSHIPEEKRTSENWKVLAMCQNAAAFVQPDRTQRLQGHQNAVQSLSRVPEDKRSSEYWQILLIYQDNIFSLYDEKENGFLVNALHCYEMLLQCFNQIPVDKRTINNWRCLVFYQCKIADVYQLQFDVSKNLYWRKIIIQTLNCIPEENRTFAYWHCLALHQTLVQRCYCALKDYSNAANYYKDAALSINKISDKEKTPANWKRLSAIQTDRGDAYNQQKDFSNALRCYQDSIVSLKQIPERDRTPGHWEMLAMANISISKIHHNQDNINAIRYNQEALQNLRHVPEEKRTHQMWVHLARCQAFSGNYHCKGRQKDLISGLRDYQNAIQSLNNIPEDKRTPQVQLDIIRSEYEIGCVYEEQGKFVAAIACFENAIQSLSKVPEDKRIPQIQKSIIHYEYKIGCIYNKEGRFVEAAASFKKVFDYLDNLDEQTLNRIFLSEYRRAALNNLHRYTLANKDLKNKKQLLKTEVQRYISYSNYPEIALNNRFNYIPNLLASVECIFQLRKSQLRLTNLQVAALIDECGFRVLILHGQKGKLVKDKNLPDDLWFNCLSFLINKPKPFCEIMRFWGSKKLLKADISRYMRHPTLNLFFSKPYQKEACNLKTAMDEAQDIASFRTLLKSQIDLLNKDNYDAKQEQKAKNPYYQMLNKHYKRLTN